MQVLALLGTEFGMKMIVPLQMASAIFLKGMIERSEIRKSTLSLLGYSMVPMSVSIFSSLPGAGAASSSPVFELHFTLWTTLVIMSLRNENSALYLAGNIRSKH